MLQHRFTSNGGPKAKMSEPDWSKEAEKSLYKNKEGVIYEPSSHVEGCLVKAAVNFQIPGKGKKTYKDLFRAAVFVEQVEIPIVPQEYEVDERAVVVNRSRVLRSRPKFDDWKLNFTLTCLDDDMQEGVIKTVLEHGGKFVGIGDFRPKFGRFKVNMFEAAE